MIYGEFAVYRSNNKGITRPLGVSAAKPTWTLRFVTRLSPASDALNSMPTGFRESLSRPAAMLRLPGRRIDGPPRVSRSSNDERIAIAVEVTLILVIVGFSLGMLNDSKQRQQGVGADAMVQPPGASALMGVSTAPISIKVADVLRRMPHVTVVAPVVIQLSTTGNVEVLSGIDLATYEKLGTPFHYLEGGPFQQPDDVLVDDFAAASQNLRVGSTLTILTHAICKSEIPNSGMLLSPASCLCCRL